MISILLFAAIAAADAPPVRVSASPDPAWISADARGQSLSVDLIIDNQSADVLDLDELQISVFDRAGKLVLRKFIDGNGSRPSIRTADTAAVAAGGKTLVFNPFQEFAPDVDLHTVRFDLKLSKKDGSRVYAESATVRPVPYRSKHLILPLKNRMIVYDGVVVAAVDRDADDRSFDPATIATDGPMKIWGNYVVVDHGHGEYALYGHIHRGSSRVKAGQHVRQGEVIAAVGASGSSKFPHLHFELQDGPDVSAEGLPSRFVRFDRILGSRRAHVESGRVNSGDVLQSR